MFTLEQIGGAIRKVKSYAEFPSLLDDFRELGITQYDNHNDNGLSVYFGADNFKLEGAAKFNKMEISDEVSVDALKKAIVSHKNEESNLFEFSKQMAQAGCKLWSVQVTTKEISYFDKQGFEIMKTKV